tara:strand:- start:718 stop:1128 length:411 start_codon:yes stop_codon:yes gene_type:complete
MSKLYWTTAEIQPAGTPFDSGSDTTFSGILTDGFEIVENEETANIEDNQEVNIAYEGGFVMETRTTTCNDGSTSILNLTVNDATAKADVRLTAEDGTTCTIEDVYVNARIGITSSGERGTKLNCKRTSSSDPTTYA